MFYAQRRQSGNVSAHRTHIKGCSFGRVSEQILRFAQNDRVSQNDRVLLLRMMSTASGGQGEAPVLALSAVPCRQESSEITVSTDTDCPIWNGLFAVRRSESRWAPDPRASPRSLAKALIYVPLLHLMRMSA